MTEDEFYVDYEAAIVEACGPPPNNWMANKFIQKLREHKTKYPNFKPDRVAEMFIAAAPKVRAYYCYQPISMFTKSIQKSRSFDAFARSQS